MSIYNTLEMNESKSKCLKGNILYISKAQARHSGENSRKPTSHNRGAKSSKQNKILYSIKSIYSRTH